MNVFRRNRDRQLAATSAPPQPAIQGEVIPANSFANSLRANGNLALNRATEVYRKNPKMVGGLAVLAGALLLNRMKSR